ncbi:glycosyltransferase family A protein [Ruminococcus sp. 1001136sp1]|jgi:glycosyltransferase involved in cell wall biosynthesis|nr:glycosyltransferase family A protein [Ruminococcus sp. 1001136sp1]MDB8766544.1 glycosyltransferase family A protein [Ruminococcus sp. 1001136sp1]
MRRIIVPRLQLLVATMNLTDIIGLCDKMHIASDALIINQSDCVKYECLFYHGYKIECYTFAERGLSRSRNNALLRCTGEILCIADDDMVYTDTYREDIINEFQKHPEADALVFNVTALNDERSGKPIEKYARVGKRESREYGSVHIAIRKRALIGKNVYFNTLFGSGATYSCGEDTLFLKELIEKDLKLYKTPIRIASVDMSDSTWFKGYNEKYFKDKGALIEAAYPRCSYLLAILQSVRNSKKSLGSYKKAAKLFSYYTSGIADYRKVISGGDATEGENIRK